MSGTISKLGRSVPCDLSITVLHPRQSEETLHSQNPLFTARTEYRCLKNTQFKNIGQVSYIQYFPQQKALTHLAHFYYVTGLNHPAEMFKTLHQQISERRGQHVVGIDLPGNGGSYLNSGKGIRAKDLLAALVSSILSTSYEDDLIEVAGMSLGSVPVAMLADLYYHHPEEFKRLLGNRKLVSAPLLIAPIVAAEYTYLGARASSGFLYPMASGIFFKRKMAWDYQKARRVKNDFFLSHHSQSDIKRLRPIITKNVMPSGPVSVFTFPQAVNRRPILQMVEQGQMKIAFHEGDRIFGVENPEDWRGKRGYYLLPGDHSAGTGQDLPEVYIQGLIQAIEEDSSYNPKILNPDPLYRRLRQTEF